MTDRIDEFVEALAQAPTMPDVFNQYGYHDEANVARRHNLRLYLREMLRRKPAILLVGEAPGYRGMRITGLPFVSRRLLRAGVPELKLFGLEQGYRMPESPLPLPESEASGTIVWGTLAQYPAAVPVLWAAFPFHPHQPGKPLSNRKPRESELAVGTGFLREFIALFQPQTAIAVGNVGESSLRTLDIAYAAKVRHPAQGGKAAFVRGMSAILGNDGER